MEELNSECKFDKADFTDLIPFISSNLMEAIIPNLEVLMCKYGSSI